jgi:hypothetical protein
MESNTRGRQENEDKCLSGDEAYTIFQAISNATLGNKCIAQLRSTSALNNKMLLHTSLLNEKRDRVNFENVIKACKSFCSELHHHMNVVLKPDDEDERAMYHQYYIAVIEYKLNASIIQSINITDDTVVFNTSLVNQRHPGAYFNVKIIEKRYFLQNGIRVDDISYNRINQTIIHFVLNIVDNKYTTFDDKFKDGWVKNDGTPIEYNTFYQIIFNGIKFVDYIKQMKSVLVHFVQTWLNLENAPNIKQQTIQTTQETQATGTGGKSKAKPKTSPTKRTVRTMGKKA